MAKFAPVLVNHRSTGEIAEVKVGDKVNFLCNGKGRGGHYRVTVRILKINPKTMKAVELTRSYHPGTMWNISNETDMSIERHSPEWLEKYADPEFNPGDKVQVDPKYTFEANKKGVVIEKLLSEEYKVQFSGRTANIGPGLLKKIN
jgi:hypothetical protein